jgi:ribonuclease PH
MLPRSTNTRIGRERAARSGRTQEIQRLIGRSLRAVTNLRAFGERQIRIDCDVIQADGGTRTAAVTGGFVALHLAFQHLCTVGVIKELPFINSVAAVSCGLWRGTPVLDLDYAEDSTADADANFVLTAGAQIIEIQGTAESEPFSPEAFQQLHALANKGVGQLVEAQRAALGLT